VAARGDGDNVADTHCVTDVVTVALTLADAVPAAPEAVAATAVCETDAV